MAFDLKNTNWKMLGQRLMNPQAANDFNAFLEKVPARAGQTVLIAAGIVWACAAAAGLFTTIKMQQMTELRNELKETQALVPIVPTINDVAIDAAKVKTFAQQMQKLYDGLTLSANNSTISITAPSTAQYGAFREAVGYVQNGGSGWRVTLDKLCVGRECSDRRMLAASLKINKVSIETPSS